jgi:large subunit ribosomal protein L21
MYAIVRTGGKQYRVEEGDSLLVDRLSADEGSTVALEPLLLSSDKTVFEKDELKKVKVEAVVKGHERGKKIHVLKFKPKRGYKRRTGHRSDLTRLEVKTIKLQSRAPAKKPAEKKPAARKPTAKKETAAPRRKPASRKEASDGS